MRNKLSLTLDHFASCDVGRLLLMPLFLFAFIGGTKAIELASNDSLNNNAREKVSKPSILNGLHSETSSIFDVRSVSNVKSIERTADNILTTTNSTPAPTDLNVTPFAHTAEVSWNGIAGNYVVQWTETPELSNDAIWLQYDDGLLATNIGNSNARTWTWGVMYPSSMLNDKSYLNKVVIYENANYLTSEYTVNIYTGGDSAPETLVGTETVTPSGADGFHEITLLDTITIDSNENMWITVTAIGTYVKAACQTTEANNQWVEDGGVWTNIGDLNTNLASYGWMIRGVVDNTTLTFDWISETGVASPYTINGLETETDYIVRVGNFGADGESEWTSKNFTTGLLTDDPIQLKATDISATKATLNWKGSQDSYNLQYRGVSVLTDFDDSSMDEWTTIDADGDGYTWVLGSQCGGIYLVEGGSLAGGGHNASPDLIVSGSYSNMSGVGALTPDNYLVSPQINLGGSITFWACGQDAAYAAEHFGVAVSTAGNTNPNDFITIQEWTLTAKGADVNAKTGTTRSGNRAQGTWYQYTVDLSNYSGMGYVAIRHFNCTDMFILDIDDIVITQPGDDSWTTVNNINVTSYELTGLAPETVYEWQVQGIYDGGTTNWVISSFTTLPAPPLVNEPYAAYEGGTLTFYYDENKEGMNGMDINNSNNTPNWFNYHSMIEEVVFHESFANCTSITSTANWFLNCSSLETIIGIENLKTNNVTNMSGMFYGCSGLTSLDLNNFDTGNVTNMSYMFSDCSSLTTIYIGESWATEKVQESTDMFMGCENIVGVDGTVYNPSFTDKTKAYSGEGGYLTFKIDAEDYLALQSFYNAFDGDNWTASKWNLVYRYFPGVSIKNGQVTAIHLENNGLNGSCTGNTLLEFPSLTTLYLANNDLSGNVSTLAGAFPMLKSLNVSGNHFSEVVPVLPLTITTLDMTCQSIEQDIEADLLDFTPEQVPSLLLYNHAGQSYYMAQSLKLANYPPTATTYQPEKPFWGFMATGFNGNIPQFNFLTSDNTYHGQSGDALYYSYPNASPMVANSYCQFKYNFRQGDANMYGGVNVLDLQTIINYMFEEYALLPFNYTAANLWADDVINVQDAVVLVNMLLDMNNSNNAGARKRGAWSGHEEYTQASIYCHDGTLYLNTSKPVAAFDIVVDGCSAIELADEMGKNGMICSVKTTGNSVHLIGYSLNQSCLSIGITSIGKLTTNGSLTISNAVLSDQDAREIAVSRNESTFTGIRTPMDGETDKIRYRLSVGRNRSIIIDTTGKKTITKDEK